MIGGTDCELIAPLRSDLAERTVAVCLRRWPEGVFLDAEETESVPLRSVELFRKLPSREFFVISDAQTEQEWDELGPCKENWNRMLHFLIGEKHGADGDFANVTVVVDEVTPEIQSLLTELQAAFNEPELASREAV